MIRAVESISQCYTSNPLYRMELIFFIDIYMVLWFGLVTKTVLATHQLFGYCCAVLAEHHGFLFSQFTLPASRSAVGKKLEGNIT